MSGRAWVAMVLQLLAFSCLWAQEASLAVVEKVAGTVGFYSADGRRVTGARVGSHPHEMCFSGDRKRLYVTDNGVLWMTDAGAGGNTISIIDVAAKQRIGVIDLGNHRRPHGIDLDRKTGYLVVTTEGPDALLLVDPVARKTLKAYDVRGKSPHMVILDPGGEWAYVSDSGSGNVAAVRLSTGEVKLIPCGANPQGGAFSEDGKTLYMTDSESDDIAIIDAEKKQRTGTIPTGKQPVRIEIAGRRPHPGLCSREWRSCRLRRRPTTPRDRPGRPGWQANVADPLKRPPHGLHGRSGQGQDLRDRRGGPQDRAGDRYAQGFRPGSGVADALAEPWVSGRHRCAQIGFCSLGQGKRWPGRQNRGRPRRRNWGETHSPFRL